jgi:hypothetical protein
LECSEQEGTLNTEHWFASSAALEVANGVQFRVIEEAGVVHNAKAVVARR